MVGENKMNSKEILAKIRELSNEEKRKINYEKLKKKLIQIQKKKIQN